MGDIDILDIYEKFANFFELTISSNGEIYEFDFTPGQVISEDEWKHSILYLGKRYSCKSADNARRTDLDSEILRRFISKAFSNALREKGYWFRGKYVAFLPTQEITQPHRDIFRMYDGFTHRILNLTDHFLLCIDPHLALRFIARVDQLVQMGINPNHMSDFSVSYKKEGEKRIDGYLLETIRNPSGLACRVRTYREDDESVSEETVDASITVPEPKPELIQKFLQDLRSNFDVVSFQRKFSFLDSKTPSRDRFAKTLEIVNNLSKLGIFPLQFGDFKVQLSTTPLIVKV